MEFLLQPTVAGAAFAALAVAGGAPLFSDGLRAFRLRRELRMLDERSLDEAPVGFTHTRGRVLLDSPLFSPITGRPCAGYRLEVEGVGFASALVAEERRAFRIVRGGTRARVVAGGGRWNLSETGRREVEPDEPVSENLSALLRSSADVILLRARRSGYTLIERALFAGDEVHVVGSIRHARPYELSPEMELLRTGTDDVASLVAERAVPAGDGDLGADRDPDDDESGAVPKTTGPFGIERRTPGRPFPGEVDLWVDGGGLLDFVLVSDGPPADELLSVSRWRTLGLLLGPAVSMAGLLYLGHAADVLHRQGRF